MVAGLETPDQGTIYIGRKDVTTLQPRQRDIAMVFQDYGLYPHMSVFDNIAFPLKIRGVNRAERSRQVIDVAERLHISQLLRRKPGQISGGEKQRVALARALVRSPQAFLMDEPLSNLDAKLRVNMRSEIKRLVSELKVTTIYVTHDQMEAMALASRVAVMKDGALEQVGPPLEIYDRPATAFVAGFIGSPPMNMFEGRLTNNGFLHAEPDFLARAISQARLKRIRDAAPELKEIIVGIRPEHIKLDSEPSSAGGTAVVDLIEPLGQDTYVHLSCNKVRIVARADRPLFRVGDQVGVRLDEDKIHLIDKTTGHNLERQADG